VGGQQFGELAEHHQLCGERTVVDDSATRLTARHREDEVGGSDRWCGKPFRSMGVKVDPEVSGLGDDLRRTWLAAEGNEACGADTDAWEPLGQRAGHHRRSMNVAATDDEERAVH
jgi:hypothetical protein